MSAVVSMAAVLQYLLPALLAGKVLAGSRKSLPAPPRSLPAPPLQLRGAAVVRWSSAPSYDFGMDYVAHKQSLITVIDEAAQRLRGQRDMSAGVYWRLECSFRAYGYLSTYPQYSPDYSPPSKGGGSYGCGWLVGYRVVMDQDMAGRTFRLLALAPDGVEPYRLTVDFEIV